MGRPWAKAENERVNRDMNFQPTISFDGVAIAVCVLGLAVGWGRAKTQLKEHEEILDRHSRTMERMAETAAV